MTREEFKKMALDKFKIILDLEDIVEDKSCKYGLKGLVKNRVTKEIVRIIA